MHTLKVRYLSFISIFTLSESNADKVQRNILPLVRTGIRTNGWVSAAPHPHQQYTPFLCLIALFLRDFSISSL
jgi:hypothetical protein